MIKFRLIHVAFLTGLAVGSNAAVAEILNLPGGGLGVTQVASFSPQRGESDMDVLKRFGEPVERHGAVGTPAISSWEYVAFKVYFENGIVIHAVHRAP